MRCHACNLKLSEMEVIYNPEELFNINECLCSECLSISNTLINTANTREVKGSHNNERNKDA